eukprot:s8489_g4.t1
MVQPTRIAIGHCSLFGLCRCPLLALPRLVSASQQPWQAARQDCRRPLLAACLWNAPLVVWSTPPGLPDLVAAGQAAEHARDQRRYPRPPDPLEEAPGYPIAGAPDIVHPSIGPPRGPPTPTPVRWEMPVLRQSTHPVDTCETDCGVLVLTPGYLPEALTLRIGLPCDVEDFIEAVERRHSDQRPAFCTRVQPARPQPLTQCATCIVMPDWVSYAALSVVCLDLRDLGTAGDGPLIAAYVTPRTQIPLLGARSVYHVGGHFPHGGLGQVIVLVSTAIDVMPFCVLRIPLARPVANALLLLGGSGVIWLPRLAVSRPGAALPRRGRNPPACILKPCQRLSQVSGMRQAVVGFALMFRLGS